MELTVERFRLMVLVIAVSWILTVRLDLLILGREWSQFALNDYHIGNVLLLSAHHALFAAMVVGLYRLSEWGREVGLISIGFSVFQALFIDFNQEAGLVSALLNVLGSLVIAVLAAAYWVPLVSERFESRP